MAVEKPVIAEQAPIENESPLDVELVEDIGMPEIKVFGA